VAIIAMKSRTKAGMSKIVDRSPGGITVTATPADQVVIVTENGAFDPRGLSLSERAVGIAHLAHEEERDRLLQLIIDDPAFHRPQKLIGGTIPGFTPYDEAVKRM
jgi:4-hydroxybutyrate CoA-transferase